MKLSNPALLCDKAFINGQWQSAADGKTFTVTNPATGEDIGSAPDMGATETTAAIAAADAAFKPWKAKTAKERGAILKNWHKLILDNIDDLAAILTAEMGKPLAEARGEIMYGASFIEWFAEEAKRAYGDVIPTFKSDARVIVTKEPIGVVAAITPWNFPNAMITRKVAPALAVGCTLVIKPAEDTPLSALALAVLAKQAGFPDGVLNIVTGDARTIGAVMTASPIVKKLSFTGSTEVGRILMQQSAPTLKKLSLELGGNAPFIVFDSADLDKAVQGAMICKFRNAGQTCVCANRLYIQDGVYDAFAEKLAKAMDALKVADGASEGATIGPLINMDAIDKVERHVKNALDNGAKLVRGGKRHNLGRSFFEPTLLTDMAADSAISCEETFGPVAGLFRFKTEAEVLEKANAVEHGLAAYFYSRDMAQCFRVSEQLEYGMVGINEAILSTEVAPFGGIKQSGFGREGSKYGIEDYLNIKYNLFGGIDGT